ALAATESGAMFLHSRSVAVVFLHAPILLAAVEVPPAAEILGVTQSRLGLGDAATGDFGGYEASVLPLPGALELRLMNAQYVGAQVGGNRRSAFGAVGVAQFQLTA